MTRQELNCTNPRICGFEWQDDIAAHVCVRPKGHDGAHCDELMEADKREKAREEYNA